MCIIKSYSKRSECTWLSASQNQNGSSKIVTFETLILCVRALLLMMAMRICLLLRGIWFRRSLRDEGGAAAAEEWTRAAMEKGKRRRRGRFRSAATSSATMLKSRGSLRVLESDSAREGSGFCGAEFLHNSCKYKGFKKLIFKCHLIYNCSK